MDVERIGYIASLIVVIAISMYIVMLIAGTRFAAPSLPQPLLRTLSSPRPTEGVVVNNIVLLPYPRKITNMSVEEAILLRRSIREYTGDSIKLEHLSMILWAAYGITETRWGLRAAPSAGATYPLEIYVVVGEKGVVIDSGVYLESGVYKYDVYTHTLRLVKKGDYREELYVAALSQEWVRDAPVNIVIFAVFERTTRIYGYRGEVRYVPMEVGHAGQNIYLMATALGYGTVVIGAFYDDEVSKIVGAEPNETPMYIVPIGVPKHPYRVGFEDIASYLESRRRGVGIG